MAESLQSLDAAGKGSEVSLGCKEPTLRMSTSRTSCKRVWGGDEPTPLRR